MSKSKFVGMSRNELANYMVAHRGTPEEIEARREYIRRFAEKARERGIDIYSPEHISPPQE